MTAPGSRCIGAVHCHPTEQVSPLTLPRSPPCSAQQHGLLSAAVVLSAAAVFCLSVVAIFCSSAVTIFRSSAVAILCPEPHRRHPLAQSRAVASLRCELHRRRSHAERLAVAVPSLRAAASLRMKGRASVRISAPASALGLHAM